MKIEPDLIREIMSFAEAIPAGESQDIPAIAGHNQMVVNCHAKHLCEAGYLEASIVKDERGRPAIVRVIDLTWKGHEFLSLARNEEGWARVKSSLSNKVVSVSVSVMTRVLEAYALKQFGLQ